MGRGRAKAKQTKVARELKYHSGSMTDLERLRAELAGGSSTASADVAATDVEDDVDEDDEDEDFLSEGRPGR